MGTSRSPGDILPRIGARTSALASERGSMLVEAMVAGALLVILALGFLNALDTTARSSADNKGRSVAASLAQDDMERMRAMKVNDLNGMSQSRTRVLDGISYTIASRAVWVDDATGDATCIGGQSTASYLKVTSTVTWPTMGGVKPIKSESIVAVPNGSFGSSQGSLQATVQNRAAAGVPAIPVTFTGTSGGNGVTDSGGCVFWGFLPVGAYSVSVNQPGYVDRSGAQAATQSASVTGGNTTNVVFAYDRAADLDVSFDTQVASVTRPASAKSVMVANSALPSPSTRTFTSATATAMISTDYTLFPFSDGYAVWGGSCAGADPRTYSQSAPIASTSPGGTGAVTVRLPALNVRITRGSSTSTAVIWPSAHVTVRPMTAGCGSSFVAPLNSTANLAQPGMPYGNYRVCADDGVRKVTSATIQDRAPAGTATTTLRIPLSGGTAGVCT